MVKNVHTEIYFVLLIIILVGTKKDIMVSSDDNHYLVKGYNGN